MNNLDPITVAVFFGCCLVLGLGSFLFFQFNRNASLKRRLFLGYHLLADAFFLGFMGWIGAPWQAFLLIVPALILVTVLNLWGTKFCPHCGKTIFHAYRAGVCSRCGQPLKPREV